MNLVSKVYRKLGQLKARGGARLTRWHLQLSGQVELDPRAVIESGAEVQFNAENKLPVVLQVGANSRIKRGAILAPRNGFIRIGKGCSINPYCVLLGYGGITIGNNVRIATGTAIIAFNHNFEDASKTVLEQGNRWKGITIGDDVWIGSGVRILDGVTIGQGAVLGAGSVVTKSIPAYAVAVGVPARVIKQRA